MMRLALGLLAAALLVPASASADTFGLAAPTMVRAEAPRCLQPTGTPGELSAMTRDGVQLLTASRGGVAPGQTFAFDTSMPGCGAVATNASGAGVVACCIGRRPPAGVVRDPGGAWSAPVELGPEEGHMVRDIAAAVSERGDAIVAWVEAAPEGSEPTVNAVRRAPGQPFGEVEELGNAREQFDKRTIQAGIAADGTAFVLWTARADRSRADVMVATAPAGGPFGPAAERAEVSRHEEPSLAVARDGHALVAFGDGKSLLVSERTPGGTFGAPARVTALQDPLAGRARAALGPDGRAFVAWTGIATGGIHFVFRVPGGPWSAPTTLAEPERTMLDDVFLNEQFGGISGGPGRWSFGGAELSAALAPDGRAVLAWTDPRARAETAVLAVKAFDGSQAVTHTFGGQLANANYARILFFADGAPALAYVDRFERSRFRLRLAAAGLSTPEPPLPHVQVGGPASPTLAGDQARLRLPVECSGPCELSARLSGTLRGSAGLSLDKAGKGTLVFYVLSDAVYRNRRGRVRVDVTYTASGGTRTRTTSTAFDVVRTKLEPEPTARITGLRAVRRGSTVRVTWRTSRRVEGGMLSQVAGRATRSRFEDPLAYGDTSKGGRSFSVTLRRAEGVKFVTLYNYVAEPLKSVVRVR